MDGVERKAMATAQRAMQKAMLKNGINKYERRKLSRELTQQAARNLKRG